MGDDEDRHIIDLRERVPELGSDHYSKAVRIEKAKVYAIGSWKGDKPISDALEEGVPLPALAAAVAKAQRLTLCTHRKNNTIDPDTRLLICTDCGAAWDPVDLLLEIAAGSLQSYRSLVNRPKLAAEIKALTAQRDDMARRAKNEKAKLSRARKAKEKVQELNGFDRYELERFRDLFDYRREMLEIGHDSITDHHRTEHRRLADLVMALSKRRAEAGEEPAS